MNTTKFDVIDTTGARVTVALPPWTEFDMAKFLAGDIGDEVCAFCSEALNFRLGVCVFDWWDDSWPESYALAVHEHCMRKDCFEGLTRHIIWAECTIYRFPSNYGDGTRRPLEQMHIRYTTFSSTFKDYNREETTVDLKELTALRDPDGSVSYLDIGNSMADAKVIRWDTADDFERDLLTYLGWK